jgi:methionine--tRNA ligase beta chain
MISISDFSKVEMRVGLVTEATAVEGSNKLIREVVDFGPTSPEATKDLRIIYSGIRKWYAPEELVGKKFLYVTNLEPKMMPYFAPDGASKGKEESNGMILAVDTPDPPSPEASEGRGRKPILVQMPDEVPVGMKVR